MPTVADNLHLSIPPILNNLQTVAVTEYLPAFEEAFEAFRRAKAQRSSNITSHQYSKEDWHSNTNSNKIQFLDC